ncbi:MAG TPA: hypothetical protein PK395_07695 [bacterium]|nr:hypothetical protein [bacterium]HQP97751.1 hypothetical protein [bacterium]
MSEDRTVFHSESLRQAAHIAAVLPAFLLRFLPVPWAFLLVFFLVIHNLLLLPRYAPGLIRPGESRLGGVFLYPLAIAVLVLLYPTQFEIVVGVWALVAVGDGLSTIIGRWQPISALPWNPAKSVGGSLAFIAFGTLACCILMVWTVPGLGDSPRILLICLVCAIIAALAESLPVRIDDNLLVPFTAAPCLAILLTSSIETGEWTLTAWTLVSAIGLNIAVAVAAYFLRLVNRNGACGGAVIGIFVYILGGPAAYVLLLAVLILDPLLERFGISSGSSEAILRQDEVWRGSKYAVTHFAVALLMALLWICTDGIDPLLRLMYLAALAVVLSETVIQELSAVVDRFSFFRVDEGSSATPGLSPGRGVLPVGGTVLLVGCAWLMGFCEASLTPAVIVGATLGSWSKSWVQIQAEKEELTLDREWLSFIATWIGAIATAILAYLLGGPWQA